MIYLDNAATTQMYDEVLETMMPYLTTEYGNPGGLYALGRKAKDAVEDARHQAASLFGCDAEEVVFTSGGSEGNNTVIRGVNDWMKENNLYKAVTSTIEHDSVLRTLSELEVKRKCETRLVEPDEFGIIHAEDVAEKLNGNTGLVSVMYVNNETGVVNDIKDIAETVRRFRRDILVHSDCVQAAGNYDINVRDLGVDFATVSSHKIHGPKGVGALYVKKGSPLSPIITGGLAQEHGLRGGTENVAGIVGFGKACEMAKERLEHSRRLYSHFRDVFVRSLGENLFRDDFSANGKQDVYGKTMNIWIPRVDSQSLILMLGDHICFSAGLPVQATVRSRAMS